METLLGLAFLGVMIIVALFLGQILITLLLLPFYAFGALMSFIIERLKS